MNSVSDILSSLRDKLNNVISEYNDSISKIEEDEKFIQVLGDVVNYCKSDCLLLPFYDESILNDVIDHIFPSGNEIKKIKTAKYLIEASKSVDKEKFLQYNDSVKDLEKICKKLNSEYEKMLSNEKLKTDKKNFNNKISEYTSFLNIVGDDEFSGLISDIDLFQEIIDLCKFSDEEIDSLLSLAIKCNLKYLDDNGIIVDDVHSDIVDMKNENDKMQEEIKNLSDLLGNE